MPASSTLADEDALTSGWHGLPCWRILDADFDDSRRFFDTWLRWRGDPQAPRLLHYVALCRTLPGPNPPLSCNDDPHAPLLAALREQAFGLLPGFHRLGFDNDRVLLTLCIGEPLAQLRQQQFEADTIRVGASMLADDGLRHTLKSLARCCRRGTRLQLPALPCHDRSRLEVALRECGFVSAAVPTVTHGSAAWSARFDPAWPLRKTRVGAPQPHRRRQHCAVIGAGLAGASVAAALARRGWQVQVLDRGAEPAAGASGLPVGLVLPHVSSDDCVLSRLSRSGVRLMLRQVRQCLEEGRDWAPSGVFEREIGGAPRLPSDWPAPGLAWSQPADPALHQAPIGSLGAGLWHPCGAWIKPARLVQAWLAQPGVTFRGNTQVHALRRRSDGWELLDAQYNVLCHVERVVLANACGALPLLQTLAEAHPALPAELARLPAMQGMRGLLSWAPHAADADSPFPSGPVNGSGSVIAHIPWVGGTAWFIGSSYQPASQQERSDADNHRRNLAHLRPLLPALANTLAPVFEAGLLNAWKGTRCVTQDRLPLVGPVGGDEQPGLWLCAGMGSRGLSQSVLCAELLAAQWGGEPLPIDAKLAKALSATRAKPRA